MLFKQSMFHGTYTTKFVTLNILGEVSDTTSTLKLVQPCDLQYHHREYPLSAHLRDVTGDAAMVRYYKYRFKLNKFQ